MGSLNKLILEFPERFWDADADYFGAAQPGGAAARGRCFYFWNVERVAGAPVLITLLAGSSAAEAEAGRENASELVGARLCFLLRGPRHTLLHLVAWWLPPTDRTCVPRSHAPIELAPCVPPLSPPSRPAAHALSTLRSIFGAKNVPEPKGFALTSWASDPYARGSYSFIPTGSSDKDYVTLGEPISGGRFAWAGEHCCKERPDTVGGAMLTGLRAAVTVMSALEGNDAIAEWLEDEDERCAPFFRLFSAAVTFLHAACCFVRVRTILCEPVPLCRHADAFVLFPPPLRACARASQDACGRGGGRRVERVERVGERQRGGRAEEAGEGAGGGAARPGGARRPEGRGAAARAGGAAGRRGGGGGGRGEEEEPQE